MSAQPIILPDGDPRKCPWCGNPLGDAMGPDDHACKQRQEAQAPAGEPETPPADPEDPKPAKKAAARRPRARGKNRASGDSAATEEAAKSADEATAPVEDKVLPEEREEWFRNPGFQRMKTAWEGDDKRQMDRVQMLIQQRVWETFPEALAVMNDLFTIVREPVVNEATGEVALDLYGQPVWKRDSFTNAFIEDWTELTIRQREHFLFRITTALFEWEQRASDLWTEAMFAKGMFTERFAIEYDSGIHGTIDDRNARGNVEAAQDRYFALMNAAVSRKAEALVRTMTNLQLRLRDTLQQ